MAGARFSAPAGTRAPSRRAAGERASRRDAGISRHPTTSANGNSRLSPPDKAPAGSKAELSHGSAGPNGVWEMEWGNLLFSIRDKRGKVHILFAFGAFLVSGYFYYVENR